MRELPTGTVTLLFTDMEGSTHLLQQLGDRYPSILEACRHLLRAAFLQFHGHEVDTQGDGFFVAFARATDAVSAAVTSQRALASHFWPEGVAVRVRIGLHTGEPQLSAEGYVGLDVHRAARIMNAGHGGQILLSQTTRDLVEHDLPNRSSLRDLGAHRLKDLEHPSHLYQLVIAGLPADFPPLKTLDTHAHNLPVQLTPLIGREREVTAAGHLLQREDVRLLTLTGPGGTGKTRLGLQVAAELLEEFSDGIFFVNLAPISDPELVMLTIAQVLGIKEAPGQPLLDLLSASLREKDLLLLLDNFEQVIEAAVEVATLLARCSRLKVLVTSRAALHVRGEQEFAVPPLAVPDPNHLPDLVALSKYEAVALFISRAQAVQPEFQVSNANAPAVAEICVRLDGLPLAIELAAARIKLLPPPALLSRLEHRLQVLTSGTQDAPGRQQTLGNTIAWSYDLLNASEQRLFRCLCVFVGGATLEGIEAVSTALDDEPGQVLDGVASLIDKSLLRQSEQEGAEPRLVMLETIREYGWERLTASGEKEATRHAHAAYYKRLAEEIKLKSQTGEQLGWFARLAREHVNLRTAFQWLLERNEAELLLRLSGALPAEFWMNCSYLREGRHWLEQVLSASEGVGGVTSIRAHLLMALGGLLVNLGDYAQAERRYEESLALYQELGDTIGMAWALYYLALVKLEQGECIRARTLLEEALAFFSGVGHKLGRAFSLCDLSIVYSEQGEYDKACSSLEESLTIFKELPEDDANMALVLFCLARALFLSQGSKPTVHAVLEECLPLMKRGGVMQMYGTTHALLAEFALSQGDIVTARSLIEKSLAFSRIEGARIDIPEALIICGRITAAQGDYAAAQALYEESLALAREMGSKRVLPAGLEGLADVVTAQGALVWATRLWGAAEALRDAVGTRIPPVYHTDYERSVAATRAQLGEKDFAAAWAEGRSMTLEQVLAVPSSAAKSTPTSAGQLSATTAKPLPIYPAGLTAREVEVLRLLAQGLTDAQIAEHLVISPRTVNTHLTSIYSKIQISSRSAATRFAVEQHLV